jgi:hypothetical protein
MRAVDIPEKSSAEEMARFWSGFLGEGSVEWLIGLLLDHSRARMYCDMDNISWALEKDFTYNTVGNADGFLMYGARLALDRASGYAKNSIHHGPSSTPIEEVRPRDSAIFRALPPK